MEGHDETARRSCSESLDCSGLELEDPKKRCICEFMKPEALFSGDIVRAETTMFPELVIDEISASRKDAKHATDFEFGMSYKNNPRVLLCNSMVSADELFLDGKLMPLHTLSKVQNQFTKPPVSSHRLGSLPNTRTLSFTSKPSVSHGFSDYVNLGGNFFSFGKRNTFKTSNLQHNPVPSDCKIRPSLKLKRQGSNRMMHTCTDQRPSRERLLEQSSATLRAPWCCSTAIIPATALSSPLGLTHAENTNMETLSRRSISRWLNSEPSADAQSSQLKQFQGRNLRTVAVTPLEKKTAFEDPMERSFNTNLSSSTQGKDVDNPIKQSGKIADMRQNNQLLANKKSSQKRNTNFSYAPRSKEQTRQWEGYKNQQILDRPGSYPGDVQAIPILNVTACMGESSVASKAPKASVLCGRQSSIQKKQPRAGVLAQLAHI
ncbi:hypothetical protein O6H91_01G119700 [Diphasiastrum complanatum]|uniref:Uncharacterized protein n=2 Tax=Diphasiastrum complanatum TaxID=34168 RepID=A0ACC2EVA4_DIPCM|nr:hypothetical protein O6H91_01G119700 [Diphasiastrum complanatum]KAJ7570433.1 hypothetical protein O6H91_01G119700 [Diphasiastrum complanatum]